MSVCATVISVPLRGLWFLSLKLEHESKDFAENFRPLAGIMVLILQVAAQRYKWKRDLFPSPCGDYGSYQLKEMLINQMYEMISVPLRGLWFLSCTILYKEHRKSV